MIYIFVGDDTKNKHLAYEKFLKSVSKGTDVISISKNDFEPSHVESLYSGSGLFSKKSIIAFINIFENKDTEDFIIKRLDFIADSKNDFIFFEGKLNKQIEDKFKRAKAQIYNFDLPKEKKERFNNFLLANALGNRDKLNLWIYFRQAIDHGVGMEELVGVLFWKAKDMILKKSLGKFSEEELIKFSGKLSYLLPQARKRGLDDEAIFEQFLLEAF